MRLKKLKLFVAVALVVFILVVANIIAFNLVQSKMVASIDTKKSPTIITSSQTSVNQNTPPSQSSQSTQTSTTQTTVAPSPQPPVISHPTMRTRAS